MPRVARLLNFKAPLWLPPGTVRAVLALATVLAWLGIGAVYLVQGNVDRAYDTLMNMPPVVALVVGWYFGSRVKEETPSS